MRRLSPGTAGWVAVGVAVIVAELLDEKTMSEAFRDVSRHKIAGPVMLFAWGTLTAHLFGVIPPNRDPLHLFWDKMRRTNGSRPGLDQGRAGSCS